MAGECCGAVGFAGHNVQDHLAAGVVLADAGHGLSDGSEECPSLAPDVAAAGAWSVLECHGQNAVLADAGLQEPQSGLAGLGCVAQVRYQVHVGIFGDPPWATGWPARFRTTRRPGSVPSISCRSSAA